MALRLTRFVLVLALVASFATSAWASCVGGQEMNAAASQMACCKAGHERCPMKGSSSDCCRTEGRRVQQISIATHEVIRPAVVAPPLLATAIHLYLSARIAAVSPLVSSRAALTSPSPPPYLLSSALLI